MGLRERFDTVIDTLPEFDGDASWFIDRYISDLDNDRNREAFLDRLLSAVCEERGHQTVSIDLPVGSGEACIHCNYLERYAGHDGEMWEGEWPIFPED